MKCPICGKVLHSDQAMAGHLKRLDHKLSKKEQSKKRREVMNIEVGTGSMSRGNSSNNQEQALKRDTGIN